MMVQRYPGAPVAAAFQTLTYQALTAMKDEIAAAGRPAARDKPGRSRPTHDFFILTPAAESLKMRLIW